MNNFHEMQKTEKTLRTVKHRVNLLNLFEKTINPNFEKLNVADLNFSNKEEMSDWITQGNDRIEQIRRYMEVKGCDWQKQRLIMDLRV